MNYSRTIFGLLSGLLGGWLATAPAVARADMTLILDNLLARPGETVLLGAYATSTTADVISGFNLPIDFNSDGFVDANADQVSDLPATFKFNANTLRNLLYANTDLDRPLPTVVLIAVDSIPTGSGANVQLGAGRTKLFDVAIDVSPNAIPGTVMPIIIKVPPQPFTSLFNVAGPNSPLVALLSPGVAAAGSITVVGVPEPGTLGLLALSATAAIARLRRWKQYGVRKAKP